MTLVHRRPPLPALTSLRFFAAAEVVCFHRLYTGTPSPSFSGELLRGAVSGGYEAVGFFFVLSGFIITYVYADADRPDGMSATASEFWRARVGRLAPAYYLSLALLFPSFLYGAVSAHILDRSAFLEGIALVPSFLQAWWPPAALLWNPPAWSLSIEVVFYALFPLLVRRMIAAPRWPMLAASVALLAATAMAARWLLPLAAGAFDGGRCADCTKYLPLLHFPKFVFGVALALLYLGTPQVRSLWRVAAFVAAAAAIAGAFCFRFLGAGALQDDVVLTLLFGALIVSGANIHRLIPVLGAPWLVRLGDISYAMYVLHAAVAFWWNWLALKGLGLRLPAAVDFTIYFALVLAASALTFACVERPLRSAIVGRQQPHPHAAAAVGRT